MLKDIGLKYRWHDLRHTFVTLLAENPNISEETIRAMAGHVFKKRDAIRALEQDRLENSARAGTKLGTVPEQSAE